MISWHPSKKQSAWGAIFVLAVAVISPVVAQVAADPEAPIKNVQFQSADVRSVMTFLADHGGVNVVVSPDVDGNVTIKLSDVKWREAMDIIGRTYNLAIVDEPGNYIRVLPADKYRKERSESQKHRQEQEQLVALETRIVKISNSTSADIVTAVKSLLTERGSASSDPRSNSIILQEVPSNLETVLGYIKELDKPAKQIKISTQLLEIFSTDFKEIGINWNVTGNYATESGRTGTQTGSVTADPVSDIAALYRITALQKGWSVDAFVEAIVSSGKGRIVAHPTITTLDNTEARIQMGSKVPIKQFDVSGNVVIKFEEIGTILTVTPHITAENRILMHLKPERSSFQFDPNGVVINTSNAETHVIVGNGQTAVIGGLTKEEEIESEVGVPILKDIPLLGFLFRRTQKSVESRDLVIFVTPTIIEDDLAMEG